MKPWLKRLLLFLSGSFLGGLLLVFLGLSILVVRYHNRIYPGIMLGQLDLSGQTPDQAQLMVRRMLETYHQSWPDQFVDDDGNQYAIPLAPQAFTVDIAASIQQAYAVGRSISWSGLQQLLALMYQPPQFNLNPTLDSAWFDTVSASIAAQIDSPVVPPQLELHQRNNQTVVQVNPGHNGQAFDAAAWRNSLLHSVANLTPPSNRLPIKMENNNITPEQIAAVQTTATSLLQHTLTLTFTPNPNSPAQQWQLSGSDLIKFMRFDDSFDKQLIQQYLAGVADSVNQAPKDAKFQFDETNGKVTEFVPAENGIALDTSASTELIYQALIKLVANQSVEPIQLVFQTTAPNISLAEVNRLGIKDKLGVGASTFKGSIASRVHNVALAAARINGTLIPPGQEFSFVQAIGDISAATGYQTAYIIQDGRTQLGDGGGVCQDSTTVFRAALSAGLPITERHGHAYRVGYYEQDAKPGLDATVYSPTTDLKFLNDTSAYILVQAAADTPNRRLTVTLYGTNDGRKSEIVDHVIWDVTPPPPDVFVDDPTLASGEVKQIDWKAPGTKAKFTYRVTRNGEILQDKTFTTVYKPWAAVYLRGPVQ